MSLIERITAGAHWYKRLNYAEILVGGGLLVLFAISSSGVTLDNSLRVSIYVAGLSLTTIIVALVGLFKQNAQEHPSMLDMAGYALLTATSALLIYQSGGIASPFLPLWLGLASLAGLFGLIGIGALAVISNGFIGWELVSVGSDHAIERLILALLVAELPLAVSYIIWHKHFTIEAVTHKATQALEAKLTETSSQAEIVINSIADGGVAIDRQGSIQLINPAAQALLGWKINDAMGLNYELVLKLVDHREQALTAGKNPVEQVRVTKQPIINNELTLVAPGERKILVSLVVSPVLNNQNDVDAVIIVMRDITAEKAQERAQADFVSTASHEMRTPVAAIEGYVGLALNPATATIDEKARAYLGKAQDSVQHLGHLFQDLLSVSRADDNRLEQHPKVTDLVAYARDITESLAPKAQEKQLTLDYVPDGVHSEAARTLAPIFYANIDRDHFREVLANLIENAIKYTPAGTVKVDVTADERHITVSITDSGIGIPSQDIPHLFQKFYRVDNSATREIGGTGLGLYLCRKLIESMGGKIWLDSELSKGSTFYISLQRLSSMDIKQIKDSEAIQAFYDPQKAAEQAAQTPATPPSPAPQAVPVFTADVAAPTPVAATPPIAPVPLSALQPNVGLPISDVLQSSVGVPPTQSRTPVQAPLVVPARQGKL